MSAGRGATSRPHPGATGAAPGGYPGGMTDATDEPEYAPDMQYDEAHPQDQDDEPAVPDNDEDAAIEPPD
jgi:hypothetical protein